MARRKTDKTTLLLPASSIERKIYLLRGQRLIFDSELAALYGVTTGNLNKAVDRNIERFPEDFMFRLTADEYRNLKFQFGTSSWGGRRKLPRAFTEQGVAMLSSVLKSRRAIAVNILIMRVFTKFREYLSTHKDLAGKIDELERKIAGHDQHIENLFAAIRQLMQPPPIGKRRIGFKREEK